MVEGMDLLVRGARELGIHLSTPQIDQFQRYYQELVSWNQRMNLTAIVDYQEAQIKHFLDSLTPSLVLSEDIKSEGRVVDVGAGGGFPGVPLKLAFPGMRLALIESVGKKTSFLIHLVETLGLEDVDVYTGRSEDLGVQSYTRESFDLVVSRGVARMRVLMEYTLPFCRVGGTVVTLKKGDIKAEIEAAQHAIDVLGGRLGETRDVDLEGLRDDRLVVVVEKIKPTPSKFPRRPGLPAKHPL